MILPIELFDIVARILKNDRASLRSLSLTHRTITPFAQQQLFCHISLGGEIDDVENNDSILRAFTDHRYSHLLSYIHSLTLRNILGSRRRTRSSTQYIPNSLIPAFIDQIAPQLTSLNLIGFAPGWDHDHAVPLRASITSLLSSPNLTHLGLDGVHKFTMGLLTRCASLKSFRFSTPYPSYTSISNTSPSAMEPIELEKLDLHCWGEIPAIAFMSWLLGDEKLECRFFVARLRVLKISGGCTREVSTRLRVLFGICGSTLEHLSLGPDTCDFGSTPLSTLPSLHTISFSFNMTYYPAQFDSVDGVPRLINNGDTPFQTLTLLLSPGSAFPHGNNTLARIDLYCRLNLLESTAPPVQVQFNSATGKAEIVQQSPIKYDIYAAYFDDLVEVLMEGKRSGRLAAFKTMRVGISVVFGPSLSPDVRSEPYVGYEAFVDAFRGRFTNFESITRDWIGLEFHKVLL